jgi:hypothetical protein
MFHHYNRGSLDYIALFSGFRLNVNANS